MLDDYEIKINKDMDSDIDNAVNDILSQLQAVRSVKKPQEEDDTPLTKEQLEEFIIKNSGSLVKKALAIVDDVREVVQTAADSKDVEALAGLIGAASSAIDTLNKVYIADERNKTQVHVKQMDIDSKEKMNIADNQTRLLLSREDIMKAIMDDNNDVVDV